MLKRLINTFLGKETSEDDLDETVEGIGDSYHLLHSYVTSLLEELRIQKETSAKVAIPSLLADESGVNIEYLSPDYDLDYELDDLKLMIVNNVVYLANEEEELVALITFDDDTDLSDRVLHVPELGYVDKRELFFSALEDGKRFSVYDDFQKISQEVSDYFPTGVLKESSITISKNPTFYPFNDIPVSGVDEGDISHVFLLDSYDPLIDNNDIEFGDYYSIKVGDGPVVVYHRTELTMPNYKGLYYLDGVNIGQWNYDVGVVSEGSTVLDLIYAIENKQPWDDLLEGWHDPLNLMGDADGIHYVTGVVSFNPSYFADYIEEDNLRSPHSVERNEIRQIYSLFPNNAINLGFYIIEYETTILPISDAVNMIDLDTLHQHLADSISSIEDYVAALTSFIGNPSDSASFINGVMSLTGMLGNKIKESFLDFLGFMNDNAIVNLEVFKNWLVQKASREDEEESYTGATAIDLISNYIIEIADFIYKGKDQVIGFVISLLTIPFNLVSFLLGGVLNVLKKTISTLTLSNEFTKFRRFSMDNTLVTPKVYTLRGIPISLLESTKMFRSIFRRSYIRFKFNNFYADFSIIEVDEVSELVTIMVEVYYIIHQPCIASPIEFFNMLATRGVPFDFEYGDRHKVSNMHDSYILQTLIAPFGRTKLPFLDNGQSYEFSVNGPWIDFYDGLPEKGVDHHILYTRDGRRYNVFHPLYGFESIQFGFTLQTTSSGLIAIMGTEDNVFRLNGQDYYHMFTNPNNMQIMQFFEDWSLDVHDSTRSIQIFRSMMSEIAENQLTPSILRRPLHHAWAVKSDEDNLSSINRIVVTTATIVIGVLLFKKLLSSRRKMLLTGTLLNKEMDVNTLHFVEGTLTEQQYVSNMSNLVRRIRRHNLKSKFLGLSGLAVATSGGLMLDKVLPALDLKKEGIDTGLEDYLDSIKDAIETNTRLINND